MPPVASTIRRVGRMTAPFSLAQTRPLTPLSSVRMRRASSPSSTVMEGVAATAATSARTIAAPEPSPSRMHDAAAAVGGLKPQAKAAIRRLVEADPCSLQRGDRGRRLGDDAGSDDGIAKPVAGGERIGQMQGGAVIGAETGGNAALRPGARRFSAEASAGDDRADRLWRKRQRGHQAGKAAADDDGAAGELGQQSRSYCQHPLDSAAAATATAGSTVTSWRLSSSAARILEA